jgi:DNA-binding winged helix-turn-helix (wHTH) protein
LLALAEAKGEIVSKDELMARLWPGRVVEEGNLHVHVSALRKSLDVHGEGHRFVWRGQSSLVDFCTTFLGTER